MDPNNVLHETIGVEKAPKQNYIFKTLHITVEPIYLTLYFSFSLTDAACLNLILSRTCTLVFGYSEGNCTAERIYYVNHVVQTYAAKIFMWEQITAATFPAIICLFIGSWMDTSRTRKPYLIVPVIGMVINYALWLVFVYFPLPPYFVIIVTLPYSLCGGFVTLYTCGYCYISDVTNEDNRAFRMSVASLSIAVGTVLGYLVSNELFKALNTDVYPILFGTSFGCIVLVLLYTVFILPESFVSVQNDETVETSTNYKSFFTLSHITKSITVVTKKRESNRRVVLYLLFVITVMDIIVYYGEWSIKYLSLRAAFSWSEREYNTFSAIFEGIAAIVGIIGVWLMNTIMKLNETFIILLITSTMVVSSVLVGISRSVAGFYSAELLGCLREIIDPIIKSEIAYLIPDSEIGRVLAISSVLEEISPIVGSLLYVHVYNILVSYKPFYVYFLSSSFWIFAQLSAMIILIIQCLNARQQYEPLIEEQEDNENVSQPVNNCTVNA